MACSKCQQKAREQRAALLNKKRTPSQQKTDAQIRGELLKPTK